ncbi:MAG: autotransporter-associated beta strand repeat-containing protein [Planctomycetota bacterium]
MANNDWGNPFNWLNQVTQGIGVPPMGSRVLIDSTSGPVTIDYDLPSTFLSDLNLAGPTFQSWAANINSNSATSITVERLSVFIGAKATLSGMNGSGEIWLQPPDIPFALVEKTLGLNNSHWIHVPMPTPNGVDNIDISATELRLTNGARISSSSSNSRIEPSDTESQSKLVFDSGGVIDIDTYTAQSTIVRDGIGHFRRNAHLVNAELDGGVLLFGDADDPFAGFGALDGTVTGSGIIQVETGYVLDVSGNNSFTGFVGIDGGRLRANSGPALGSLNNFLSLAGNGVYQPTEVFATGIPVEFFGDGRIDVSAQSSPHRLVGPVRGSGTFTKTNTGALRLEGPGTGFTGDFVVNAGTLCFTRTDASSGASSLTVAQGANALLDAPDLTFETLAGGGDIELVDRVIITGPPTAAGDQFSGSITSEDSFFGTGTFLIQEAAVQAFAGDASGYTGDWSVLGTLEFAGPDAWNGDTGLTSTGTVIASGGGGFFDELTGPTGSRFHKTGDNTLLFNGSAGNFNGTTTVEEGTLRVDGFLDGTVLVLDGATLSGIDGDLDGFASIDPGGRLTPGDGNEGSTGTLEFRQLHLVPQSTLELNLGGTAATTFDKVVGQDIQILGPTLAITIENGFIPQPSQTFEVVAASASLLGGFADLQSGARLPTVDGAGSFMITYSETTRTVVLSDFVAGDTGVACSIADIALPFGILDNADILEHLARLEAGGNADVNGDGMLDFFDTVAFLTEHNQGCQ